MARIQIGGRTYTEQDIRDGKHHDDPNITAADDEHVTNVANGDTVIQAGTIHGGVVFD